MVPRIFVDGLHVILFPIGENVSDSKQVSRHRMVLKAGPSKGPCPRAVQRGISWPLICQRSASLLPKNVSPSEVTATG